MTQQDNRGLFLMLPDCLLDDTRLTETAIIGFARLMRYCQQQRTSAFHGSFSKLARIMKLSKTTAFRIVNSWEKYDLITRYDSDEYEMVLYLDLEDLWQRNVTYTPQKKIPYQRSRKDEVEVVQRHIRRAQQAGVQATLTLDQWIITLDYFNWRCAYCLKGKYHCLEHFIPIEQGGGTTYDNVVPSCRLCNRLKYSFLPEKMLDVESFERVSTYLRMKREVQV